MVAPTSAALSGVRSIADRFPLAGGVARTISSPPARRPLDPNDFGSLGDAFAHSPSEVLGVDGGNID